MAEWIAQRRIFEKDKGCKSLLWTVLYYLINPSNIKLMRNISSHIISFIYCSDQFLFFISFIYTCSISNIKYGLHDSKTVFDRSISLHGQIKHTTTLLLDLMWRKDFRKMCRNSSNLYILKPCFDNNCAMCVKWL